MGQPARYPNALLKISAGLIDPGMKCSMWATIAFLSQY